MANTNAAVRSKIDRFRFRTTILASAWCGAVYKNYATIPECETIPPDLAVIPVAIALYKK